MKTLLGIGALALIAILAFIFWGPERPTGEENIQNDEMAGGSGDNGEADSGRENAIAVTEGTYTVHAEESTVRWSGKKPLIDSYINSGTLGVASGTIAVMDGEATGSFTIDMDTLSVSETRAKPGQESALEGHLKSDRWFNVAAYPTATFTILEVMPREDSNETFVYDVRGEFTLKGETDELAFPAAIYLDESGRLHAKADFEFDRTKWGITSLSGSFFDDLADNVVDDMVALSIDLVADKEARVGAQ